MMIESALMLVAGMVIGGGGMYRWTRYLEKKELVAKKARRQAGGTKAATTRKKKAIEQVPQQTPAAYENGTDPAMYGRHVGNGETNWGGQ